MANPIYPKPITLPTDAPSPIAQFTNTSGPMSYEAPQPINNTDPSGPVDFSQSSIGKNAVQSQNIAMPIGYDRQQSKPNDNGMSSLDKKFVTYGGAAEAGLGQTSAMTPNTDSSGALLQVAGATLGGAASGAVVGGVPGAVVGGLVGLVSGGINAWVGTHSARTQARKNEAINLAILKRQEALNAQQQANWETNRQDNLKQQALNNKTLANQSQWSAMEKGRQALNDMIAQDENLKQMLIERVR